MGSINCKELITTKNNKCGQDEGIRQVVETNPDNEEYVEGIVCKETDINDNEMKTFDLNEDGKILLVKRNGHLSALGTKCTHYGAPLSTGVLGRNIVRCPWHGACFNLKTGDIEDFPGLDSIPCYQVKVNNGEVTVRAKRKDLQSNKRIKDMVKRDPNNSITYVIVGGGPAGGVAAETLRQEGFTGRIVMICKENALPYDRIKLSKNLAIEISSIQYRTKEFYDEHSIETLLGVEATKLDTQEKTVTCSNGYAIKYDKILLATGSRAVKAPIPGSDLKNVFTLRSHEDVVEINKYVNENINVVCLGSSFIALEAAAYFADKVKTISLVGRDDAPLKPIFGKDIGKRIINLFEDNNVNMIMKSGIEKCIGVDGKITSVELKDGSNILCDILVMGTGTRLNTEFVNGSDITVNANGSIDTDNYLMSNVPDVYVSGDIANAPIYPAKGQKATIGHYQLAQYHGKIAATNMAGNKIELKAVPFFWTMLFGKSFRYSGYGNYNEIIIQGNLDELKFVSYNVDKDENIVAVTGCTPEPIVMSFNELQAQGVYLHKNDILGDPKQWISKLN